MDTKPGSIGGEDEVIGDGGSAYWRPIAIGDGGSVI